MLEETIMEFEEKPTEIIIYPQNKAGAAWIARNLTTNVAPLHYTEKRRAYQVLSQAASDGLRIRRIGKPLVLRGEYHETGYEIWVAGPNVRPLYSAGNAPGDSQMVVPPERGVGLKTLRKFCVQTGKEMAFERFAKWGGAERVPNPNEGEL